MGSLRDEMAQLPMQFHVLPFHEHIHSNTPVLTIKAATERLLWHQRLGHPSDCYLFNAHRHADGVPRFPHMDRVLDICPACIRSKQTKNAAGGNTTRTAEQPHQGLSIDFSFSGTRSKNTFNRFPIGTKVKKKFGDKTHKGKVMRSPADATERDPNADDFGKLLNHGESSVKIKTKKTVMSVRWNRLPMVIYPDSILTSIVRTTTLASMARPHGSLSPITSQG